MAVPYPADDPAARRPATPVLARAAVAAGTGLATGALTSVGQAYLNSPWLSLVNSASPWLVPMFALGALWRRPGAAALAGAGTGLAELAGYYATAALRGYPAGHAILLFWAACALLGGPLFGVAGLAWWRGLPRGLRGLGAAALPAAFWAEAAVSYAWRLHYLSSAALLAVLGAGAFAATGWRGRQYVPAARWLLAALPAGVAAELIIGLVYSQAF
jgi:hypothetical protein